MRTAVLGCVATFVFSACGGGSSPTSPAIPKAQPASSGQLQPGSGQRHTRSTGPCTPDSYGYCLYHTSSNLSHGHCYKDGIYQPYTTGYMYYTLYYNGDADGNYTYTLPPGCSDFEAYWSPDDPANATGDPNLP